MQYKNYHYQITNELLSGRFILWTEPHFIDLEKQKEEYILFFEKSFDYKLIVKKEFAYLTSDETKEKFSTNTTVFLSVLCYEISSQGKDIEDKIENGYFNISEVQELIVNPSYVDIFNKLNMNSEKIVKYLKDLESRNIINFDKNQKEVFKFTKAIDLFFEFAKELAENKIRQMTR